MMRAVLGAALWASAASSLLALDEPRLPTSPQPLQVLAHIDDGGNVIIRHLVPEWRQETRERTVPTPNGEERKVQYTVTVPVFRQVEMRFEGKKVQFYNTDGEKIDAEKAAEQLKQDAPILLSADGRKVDPFYLRIIKKGTLVVLAPPPPARPVPAPQPVPPPVKHSPKENDY
jgi:hypothetical protein